MAVQGKGNMRSILRFGGVVKLIEWAESAPGFSLGLWTKHSRRLSFNLQNTFSRIMTS